MAKTKPDWAYWRALADTSVSLRRCIALSLDLNPMAFGLPAVANDILMRRYEFPYFVDEKTKHSFNYRLRILAAHRLHGKSFSAAPAGGDERSVFLTEFAGWALRNFTEAQIPNELAVLGAIGDDPLPKPPEPAKIAGARRAQSAGVNSVDKATIAKPALSQANLKRVEDVRTAYKEIREQTQKVPSRRKVAERSGYDRGFVGKHWEHIGISEDIE
jgi:hypothetical protein